MLELLDCLSLIHVFMESLPQAVIQAGAIVFKSVVSNNEQCFYDKNTLEDWFDQAQQRIYEHLNSKYYFILHIHLFIDANRLATTTTTTDEPANHLVFLIYLVYVMNGKVTNGI